jgi:hypothetical protein
VAAAGVAAAGVVAAAPADAVVGGTPVSYADYPYFANFPQPMGLPPSCGASVIADSWILTAAHCVDNWTFASVNVPAAQVGGQGTVVLHPLWIAGSSSGDDGHDVALVHLPPGALSTAAKIQVGAPWDWGAYAAGLPATMMGTGKTFAGDQASGTFRAVATLLRSDDYMNDIFDPWYWFDDWHDELMIGAGGDNPNNSLCYGDSGSPLVVSRGGHHVQVGVASFIQDADNCHGAAGFAEVGGAQLAWIASQVPEIMAGWGPCTSPGGAPGQPRAAYGGNPPAAHWDGPVPWNIWCEGPPPTATVPDVEDMTLTGAVSRLQAAGLAKGSVSNVPDASSNSIGQVMNQSPPAGTVVPPGSTVALTIGKKPKNPCP